MSGIIIKSSCDAKNDTITITMKRLDWWDVQSGFRAELLELSECLTKHEEEEGLVEEHG